MVNVRMGVGASRPSGYDSLMKTDVIVIPSASPRSLAEMGAFSLEDKQRRVVQYLLKIAQNMIFEKTNVIHLKESLQTKTCKTLNMFIQSNSATYATGRFKNPLDPSHSTVVAIVPEANYETRYEPDTSHKALCNMYISFMLRLTTLVCALLSSVYVNKDMATLYRAIQDEEDPTRPLPVGEERVPMPTELLEKFTASGWFHKYKNTSLYFFAPPPKEIGDRPVVPKNPVFWDVLQGLVYAMRNRDKTLRFRFDMKEPPLLTPGYVPQRQEMIPGIAPIRQLGYDESKVLSRLTTQEQIARRLGGGVGGGGGYGGGGGGYGGGGGGGYGGGGGGFPGGGGGGFPPGGGGNKNSLDALNNISPAEIARRRADPFRYNADNDVRDPSVSRSGASSVASSYRTNRSINPSVASSGSRAPTATFGGAASYAPSGYTGSLGSVRGRNTVRNSRKTRRTRRTRKTRKNSASQVGGDYYAPTASRAYAYKLTIDSIPRRNPVIIMLSTVGQAFPPYTPGVTPQEQQTKSKPVDDLIRGWESLDSSKPGAVSSESSMEPLEVNNPKTWDKLQEIFNQITTSRQGPSLAAYRAFLLASSKNKDTDESGKLTVSIGTTFCKDETTDKLKLTETPGYATLQSLYSNSNEFGTAQERQRGDQEWAKDSTDKSIVTKSFQEDTGYTIIGETPSKLRDLKFTPKATIGAACDVITNAEGVKLLTGTHQRLRNEYDAHLNWVYWFLSKIVRIDLLTPDNSFVLEFNKKFMMPEKPGSNVQQQLEFYIAAARRKLLKHYATVERVYNRAIGEIERAASHASAAPSGPSGPSDKSNE